MTHFETYNQIINFRKSNPLPKDVIEKQANACRGKKRTAETRKKMSESQKGLRWFTNGEVNSYSRTCPDGFRPGMTRKIKKVSK